MLTAISGELDVDHTDVGRTFFFTKHHNLLHLLTCYFLYL